MGCRVFLVEQRLQGNRNARYGYCRATNAAKESAPRYQTLAFTPFLGASSAPLHLLTFLDVLLTAKRLTRCAKNVETNPRLAPAKWRLAAVSKENRVSSF
jgi:hypothetical protein